MTTLSILILVYVTINLTIWGVEIYSEHDPWKYHIGGWILTVLFALPVYAALYLWAWAILLYRITLRRWD